MVPLDEFRSRPFFNGRGGFASGASWPDRRTILIKRIVRKDDVIRGGYLDNDDED
jgi:hypothetical protein